MEAPHIFRARKCLKDGAEQKPRFLLCELRKAKGEAHQEEGPVDLPPAERVRHGRRTPDLPAQLGEPETDNSPMDCCPGERPSQEGAGRYPSAAGKAKRRGEAQQGLFQHPVGRAGIFVQASLLIAHYSLLILTAPSPQQLLPHRVDGAWHTSPAPRSG